MLQCKRGRECTTYTPNARQIEELKTAVRDGGIDDVVIAAPFLGKVVVWCGSETSRDHLLSKVALEA